MVAIKGVDPKHINRQDKLKTLSIREGEIAGGKFDSANTKKPVLFERPEEDHLKYAEDNKRALEMNQCIRLASVSIALFGPGPY